MATQNLVNLPLKHKFRTHLYLNLKAKIGTMRDIALDAVGIKSISNTPVQLGNYGAIYRDRMASYHLPRVSAKDLALISGPRMATDAQRSEIMSRSQEQITDEFMLDPSRDGTSRAMVTKLVHDELNARSNIKTVCNIGAFVDNQTAYLASRHPDVKFISVDTMTDIDKVNSFFQQRPNWSFKSGYALEMMERGELAADLFFMTSTSVCFTFKELEAFIGAMARSAKVIIFNEPWWPTLKSPLLWKVPRPEDIDPVRPPLGLIFFNYQHNYIHYLAKHGFFPTISRIVNTAGDHWHKGWFTLQIVAERRS